LTSFDLLVEQIGTKCVDTERLSDCTYWHYSGSVQGIFTVGYTDKYFFVLSRAVRLFRTNTSLFKLQMHSKNF